MRRTKYFFIILILIILFTAAQASYLVSARTPDKDSIAAKKAFTRLTGIGTFAFYNEYPDFRHRTSGFYTLSGSSPFLHDTNFSSIVYRHD